MSCVHRTVSHDSRWSWIVCLSASLSVLILLGFAMSFGVFHPYLMKYFSETKGRTSWTGSIVMGLILFSGTFAVFLTDRFGHRTVNMASGFTCCASLLASSFVNHLTILYFSFSLIYGFCGGLLLNIALTEVKIHFRKYFALSAGMIVSGSSTGILIFSQVNEHLLEALGWRYSFRIMSGLTFFATIITVTYDDRNSSERKKVDLDLETVELSLQDQNDGGSLKKVLHTKEKVVTAKDDSEPIREKEEINPERILLEKSEFVNESDAHQRLTLKDVFSLFKNVPFVFGLLSTTIVCFGFFTPQIHLMQFSVDLGMSHRKSAQLYIYFAIATIIARLVSGHLATMVNLSPLTSLQLTEFFCAISVILLPLAKTYSHLVVFCVAYGLTSGAAITVNILFVTSVVEPAKGGISIGVSFMFSSLTVISGPPLAGYIADTTGSYVTSFYVVGGIMVFGSFLPCIIHIKKLFNKRQ